MGSVHCRPLLAKIALSMMKLIVSSCLVGLAMCQYGNQYAQQKRPVKILKEQRFNSGDGNFGSAYASEDGTVFKEEALPGGERRGQYSYIDQSGKTITVKYSAGKDGFKILEGAHVPSTGQTSAPHDPNYREPASYSQSAPSYNQNNNQQYNNNKNQQYDNNNQYNNNNNHQYNNNNNQYNDYSEPADPNRNPFINPHDPTHNNFQYNTNAANHAPGNSYSQQTASVPACADCAGANPFINPYDPTHQSGYVAPQQPAAAAFNHQGGNSFNLNY